jgi:crotonobetainyl-CoA:carnitine CoA-transferase CaiB-like acyl-CoA transferase
VALLHAAGVPAGLVNTVPEALADPQVRHRGMVLTEVDPPPTRAPLQLLGTPVKVAGTAPPTFRTPPRLGEHTAEVLREWLQYDDARIRMLDPVTRARAPHRIPESLGG